MQGIGCFELRVKLKDVIILDGILSPDRHSTASSLHLHRQSARNSLADAMHQATRFHALILETQEAFVNYAGSAAL